jgi:hypothetical protein
MAYGTFALPGGIRPMRNLVSAAIVGFLVNQTTTLLREFQKPRRPKPCGRTFPSDERALREVRV